MKTRPTVLGSAFLSIMTGALAFSVEAQPFINEIHYDNTGADQGEFVEVAGPAGTDLSGYSLVFYNGNGGASYATDTLSGILTDQADGFGFAVVNRAGIQNGSPDGIALVAPNGQVLEFISYEGFFTAVGGPADGLTSTDIGVSEPGNLAVGLSLQLTGTGQSVADFTWAEPASETPGQLNQAQVFSAEGGGEEIDEAPQVLTSSPANGETGVAVDSAITITFSEAVTIASAEDIVCDISGLHPVTVSGSDTVFTFSPDSTFGELESCNFTLLATEVSDLDGNIDNLAEDFSISFTTRGGLEIVINELLADPANDLPGDANGDGVRNSSQDEFVELVNPTESAVDISGWTISDAVNVRHTFAAGSVIEAGCSVVVFGGGSPSGEFGGALVSTASSGQLGLNNGGDTVTLSDGLGSVEYAYGSEGGNNQSLTRNPDISGEFVAHSQAQDANDALYSPGTLASGTAFNGCEVTVIDPPPPVEAQAVKIHEVQGSGEVSPLANGTLVEIEAVVVGDFQSNGLGTQGDLGGFYLQEEDSDADDNVNSSEGIFVFQGFSPVDDVNVGDVVKIVGEVSERFNETQINISGANSSLMVTGTNAEVTVAQITLPVSTTTNADGDLIADLEFVEGMLVQFPQSLSVTELFQLGRFGEMRLAQGGRLFQFTERNASNPGGFADHVEDIAGRNITLDDGLTLQNPNPVRFPAPGLTSANAVRMTDEVTGLTGVVRFSRGSGGSGDEVFRILPTVEPSFVATKPREVRPDVGGSLQVASFNVLNFFNTLNQRGADTAFELERQLEKTTTALVELDADIYGLIEVENDYVDGGNSSIALLVNTLNADGRERRCGTYDYVDPGSNIGTDQIAVGFIYCTDTVQIAEGSSLALLDDSVLASLGLESQAPLFNGVSTNRVALATSFTEVASGESVTITVNHFKSKGSSGLSSDSTCVNTPALNGNCDQGDGAGFWNLRRTQAAEALAAWLQSQPTGLDDEDTLIIGDLNAYLQEDPINALRERGYTNLIDAFVGRDAYSYVFDGQAGNLDHGMANAALLEQISGAAEWHINSDEASVLDYNTDFGRPQDIFDGTVPFRSSDHDPLIIGLDLQSSAAAVRGDWDGDGDVDINDVRGLMSAVLSGNEVDLAFDIDENGIVNIRDARALMNLCDLAGCAAVN